LSCFYQEIGAVPLSACDIKNIFAMDELPGQRIPVKVFDGNVSLNAGDVTLSSPFEIARWSLSL